MVEYPGGWVTGLEQGTGAPVAEVDTGVSTSMVLLGMAGAYHVGQTRLSAASERAARDLWLRMRPITDADLSRWMDEYDTILAGAARQQAGLTRTYVRTSTAQLGATVEPVIAVPASDAERVSRWLRSPQGEVASSRLRSSVEALVDKGEWTVEERALFDRLKFLHSPVVKQRWRQSEGFAPTDALQVTASDVQAEVYAAQRAVEAEVMGSIDWPTFKNGVAMLYKRVPQAGACGWCRTVATRLYSLASYRAGARWHVGCRCTWQAVTFKEAKAYASVLQQQNDYYAAASSIGLYEGDRPDVKARFDAEAAAAAGYTSRRISAQERASFAAERGAGNVTPSRGSRTTTAETRGIGAAQPGQVTPERLASVRLQIEQLRTRPANEWSRQRLADLADELEALLRALGQ